jgi:LysM repeat protein
VVAFALAAFAVFLGWRRVTGRSLPSVVTLPGGKSAGQPVAQAAVASPRPTRQTPAVQAPLPAYQPVPVVDSIPRMADLHTIIPNRPSERVRQHTVDVGDSIFEIATRFDVKPETVLWANYDLLNDNPDLLALGMELQIPPVDGVYYEWKAGDSIEAVAARFQAKPDAILNWTGNNLDLVDPQVEPGSWILIQGGKREYRQWVIPTIPRGRAGVSRNLYGAGTCEGGYNGALGTGGFVWPAGNHSLSGNDYWDGHLGIDIAAGEGAPIYAADSGVVVFAGWATGGYGYMVMVDHGNGYQTVYAHMSSVSAACGASVGQGGTVGYSGSTGNSTGAHLHFEVRFQGGFVNPWYVLP